MALLLVAVLHFIPDSEDPEGIVEILRDALPAGSYLALSHATGDIRPEAAARAAAVYDRATSTITLRTHRDIERYFAGFDVLEPGVVQLPLWRPDGRRPRDLSTAWGYCGAGRKQD